MSADRRKKKTEVIFIWCGTGKVELKNVRINDIRRSYKQNSILVISAKSGTFTDYS